MNKPIYYEKHPVSTERRAALIGHGFKIIDIKFMPDDYENPDLEPDSRGDDDSDSGIEYDKITADEIKSMLDEAGFEYNSSASKKELFELLTNESDS